MDMIKVGGRMHRNPIRKCSCDRCDYWRPVAEKIVESLKTGWGETEFRAPFRREGEKLFDADGKMFGFSQHADDGDMLVALLNDMIGTPAP